jgi:hypothetical protein
MPIRRRPVPNGWRRRSGIERHRLAPAASGHELPLGVSGGMFASGWVLPLGFEAPMTVVVALPVIGRLSGWPAALTREVTIQKYCFRNDHDCTNWTSGRPLSQSTVIPPINQRPEK